MRRYLICLIRFWETAIASQLEYKSNILIELLSLLASLIGSIFILSLFFKEGHQLGGWTWEEALVVQGVYTFLNGIFNTFLKPNLGEIIKHVREGTLDFVILKPIDSQFCLSTRTFSPAGIPEIFVGLFIAIFATGKAVNEIIIWNPLLFILTLTLGVIILYSLWFITATTSIWFVQTWSTSEVLRSFLTAGRFPSSAYPVNIRLIFTFVFPITFITTIPAEALLGNVSISNLVFSLVIAFIFLSISRRFWRFSLRHYTSASS
tara:strand:+ start:583 stop:1371 length:789 start_codon:yes stop_codon:yes gene_type:complete